MKILILLFGFLFVNISLFAQQFFSPSYAFASEIAHTSFMTAQKDEAEKRAVLWKVPSYVIQLIASVQSGAGSLDGYNYGSVLPMKQITKYKKFSKIGFDGLVLCEKKSRGIEAIAIALNAIKANSSTSLSTDEDFIRHIFGQGGELSPMAKEAEKAYKGYKGESIMLIPTAPLIVATIAIDDKKTHEEVLTKKSGTELKPSIKKKREESEELKELKAKIVELEERAQELLAITAKDTENKELEAHEEKRKEEERIEKERVTEAAKAAENKELEAREKKRMEEERIEKERVAEAAENKELEAREEKGKEEEKMEKERVAITEKATKKREFFPSLGTQTAKFLTDKKGKRTKEVSPFEVFLNNNKVGYQIPFTPGESAHDFLWYLDFTPDSRYIHFTYGSRLIFLGLQPFELHNNEQSISFKNFNKSSFNQANSFSSNNNKYHVNAGNIIIFNKKNDKWQGFPMSYGFSHNKKIIIDDHTYHQAERKIHASNYALSELTGDRNQLKKIYKDKGMFKVNLYPKKLRDQIKTENPDNHKQDTSYTDIALENTHIAYIGDTDYYTDEMAVEDGALLAAGLLLDLFNKKEKPDVSAIAYSKRNETFFCTYDGIPVIIGFDVESKKNGPFNIINDHIATTLRGHTAPPSNMLMDDSGKYLVSFSNNETIFWDLEERMSYKISGKVALKPLAFSPTEPILVLSKLRSNSLDKLSIVLFDIDDKKMILNELELESNYNPKYDESFIGHFINDASFNSEGQILTLLETLTYGSNQSLSIIPDRPHQNIFVLDFQLILGDDYKNGKLRDKFHSQIKIDIPDHLLTTFSNYDHFFLNNLEIIEKKGEFEKTINYQNRIVGAKSKNASLIQSKWEELNFKSASQSSFKTSVESIGKYDPDTEIFRATLKGGLAVMIKLPPKDASEFNSIWWENAIVTGQKSKVSDRLSKYNKLFLSNAFGNQKFPVKIATDINSFFDLSKDK